jgi:general secretion pathway protein C
MLISILVALVLSHDAPPPDLAVSGVVVRAVPERSTAILSSGGRTRVVSIGDQAFGGRVVAITPKAVVIEFDGERRELRLPNATEVAQRPAPPPPVQPAVPAAPPAAAPEDPRTPPRTMERAAVERRLADEIPRILAETAIVPVMEEGRVAGVQIARMPEGSLLTDAGLRTGDVIREVNGTVIDGMGTLIGLWTRLQTATELRAVVLRNGQPVSLVVSFR